MTPKPQANSDWLARIVVALTLLLLPLIYFFPAALGKVTLAPGDGWSQIFGIRVLIGQMLAHGELPLWNPYIFAGMPLLASIQPGALYPPTWLFAVLSPQLAMNLLVLTTYHLALFGTYLYLRRIGSNRVGAVLAAVTFAFGGYMIAHLGHTNRISAAVWLPWILLAIEELQLQVRWRWVALGAAFIALQLYAGEPQMTLYTIMVAGAYGLATLLFRVKAEVRVRFLGAALVMSVCGGLLSMIQLLPERELLKFGERAGIDYEYFAQFSFPPNQIFELFFPYFFGGAALGPYIVPYWGKWNVTETCGYVGMAAWLLAFAAIFAVRLTRKEDSDRLIWFWAACAVVALLLAFGSFLPFDIYRKLHRVPVYNLFRASGRHLMEFNFAIAVLAGLGVTALARIERPRANRAVFKAMGLLALVTERPLPQVAGSLTNPDIYFPVVFFGLSLIALVVYARRWSSVAGAAIVLMLFLDLMAFGFSYEWRLIDYNIAEKLADPPTVKWIKEHEPDVNSFRVLSHSNEPYNKNTDLIDYPNISIARGLQSVNGYDPVRIWRMAEIAGTMTLDGYITESNTFASAHQGLNLLNAKYLLTERASASSAEKLMIEDISFNAEPIGLQLGPGTHTQIQTNATATELAIISAMGRSDHLATGTPILRVKLHTADGQLIQREIQAGRDTSEWAYDRPDVTANAKHTRAPIAETWDADGFKGHRYLARLSFDRAQITSVDFEYVPLEADITIARASLFDAESKTSQPLDSLNLPADRWREAAQFGEVRIFENLKAMPRAWFAPRVAVLPSVEVLRTIKTGFLKDGAPFDPSQVVLLESELFANRNLNLPTNAAVEVKDDVKGQRSAIHFSIKDEARVTRYEPRRIEVQTNNPQAGFLVLSEIYFRGWEAWVDGQRAPVERVNYTLRGVNLPPGNHKVEFVFRAHSFRTGAAWSALGVVLLLAGGFVSWRRRRGKRFAA
jgi:hypothetical protein